MEDHLFTDAPAFKGEANWFHHSRSYSTVLFVFSVSRERCSDVSAYKHKHFCKHTNTTIQTQTHMNTRCDCRGLTVLLKSVCKQMFGRMFSTGDKRLNSLHADDQRCLLSWQTCQLKHTDRHVHETHLQLSHTLPHICHTLFHIFLPHTTHIKRRWKYNHSNNSYYPHTCQHWILCHCNQFHSNLCHFSSFSGQRQMTPGRARSKKEVLKKLGRWSTLWQFRQE